MNKIKIKTGANISYLLQSTVNIPQAFTELIKNSIQNLATIINVEISEDQISVSDNGRGFDHTLDDKGRSDFDRYFVYGNSYDNTSGKGIRLGHMGIGGKLANDKLSDINPNWSIYTKNKHLKSFKVNYAPPKSEFLDDYSPTLEELPYDDSYLSFETGTKVTINNVNPKIKRNLETESLWVKQEICSFFGLLVQNSRKRNNPIQITLNGRDLIFDYRLPGHIFLRDKFSFAYGDGSEVLKSEVEINLSRLNNRAEVKNSPIKGVEIADEVKICQLKLNDANLVDEIYEEISLKEGQTISPEIGVLHFFNSLIGFVVCPDLGLVLDETGMPAKDLSHHSLRNDHVIVKPFLKSVYRHIIISIRKHLGIDKDKRREEFNKIASEVLSMIDDFDKVSLHKISNEETGVTLNEEDETGELGYGFGSGGSNKKGKGFETLGAAQGEDLEVLAENNDSPDFVSITEDGDPLYINPQKEKLEEESSTTGVDAIIETQEVATDSTEQEQEEQQQEELSTEESPDELDADPPKKPYDKSSSGEDGEEVFVDMDNIEDIPDYVNPDILPKQIDAENIKSSIEEITEPKNIIYDIVDFGSGYEFEMSSHHMYGKLIITINSGNHKFKRLESSGDSYAMATHIGECMVKEISFFKNPEADIRDIEYKISEFYLNYGDSIKDKFSTEE